MALCKKPLPVILIEGANATYSHPTKRKTIKDTLSERQTDRQSDTHENQPDALPTESNAKYATVFDVRHGTVNTKRTKQEAEVSIATKRKRKRNSDVV